MAIGQPSGRLSLGGASAQITPPQAWTPTQRGRQEAHRPGGVGMSAQGGLGKAEGPSPQLSPAWSSPAGLAGFGRWERSLPRDPDPRAPPQSPAWLKDEAPRPFHGAAGGVGGSTCGHICGQEAATLSQGLCPHLSRGLARQHLPFVCRLLSKAVCGAVGGSPGQTLLTRASTEETAVEPGSPSKGRSRLT